jgi:hypothetical protein
LCSTIRDISMDRPGKEALPVIALTYRAYRAAAWCTD